MLCQTTAQRYTLLFVCLAFLHSIHLPNSSRLANTCSCCRSTSKDSAFGPPPSVRFSPVLAPPWCPRCQSALRRSAASAPHIHQVCTFFLACSFPLTHVSFPSPSSFACLLCCRFLFVLFSICPSPVSAPFIRSQRAGFSRLLGYVVVFFFPFGLATPSFCCSDSLSF